MRQIVVTNTKGGVGKTTSSMYLAAALANSATVELWDADAQGSATEWALRAKDVGEELPFAVKPVNLAQLRRPESAADYVVIDTAPGDWRGIDIALENADVAILPTAPSGLDLDRLWQTEKVASAKCPSYVLLTLADRRTKSPETALQVLEAQGVGYFETTISARQAIRQSYGHTPGPNFYGYDVVLRELREAMSW